VARHFYLNLNGAYGADSVKLAAEMGWSPAQMLLWCGFAALTGLWAAFLTHLKAYYTFGANFLEGAPGIADYRTFVAVQDFRSTLSSLLDKPTPPDRWRLGFTVYGAAVTVTLAWLRRHFPTFPLHPLGFPLAYAINIAIIGTGEHGRTLLSYLLKLPNADVEMLKLFLDLSPKEEATFRLPNLRVLPCATFMSPI